MTDEQEYCVLCPKRNPGSGTWICCDVCETWYHVRCLKMTVEEFEVIDQYHCSDCAPKAGPSTVLRKSSRRQGRINYADLVNGIVSHQSKWRVVLDSHQFQADKFERIQGEDLTLDWLRATGFKEPVIVKRDKDGTTDGLSMKMPEATLTVDDVRDYVGADTPVEVIDVATQSEQADWNMASWADYFKTEPKDRVYNVISLEITGTPLADKVQRPKVVRELDWIENFWPEELRPTEFPKVQLYCLMSVRDSYTDFHIDFAGSSVFYHILSGSKTFYFVEPTPTHLKKYAKWSSSADQSTTFFGDDVPGKCYKVELTQGDTMMIPAGWIHAVYTPSSSVVIGGNFVHSLNIPMQYRVAEIEGETNVPPKFRFPYFEKLNWFVALGCSKRGPDYLSSLPEAELFGLLALTTHLYQRQRNLKRDPNLSKDERHMIRASVPQEVTTASPDDTVAVLRRLNQTVCDLLKARKATTVIGSELQIPTKEEEETQDKSAKSKIKIRIKLNSTPSATHSGDEESTQGEQQVPISAAPAKLKLKLPTLSAITTATTTKSTKSGRKSKRPVKDEDDDVSESTLDGASDGELDEQLETDDDEWNEFENQLDDAFDDGQDHEIDDDGELDMRSSDSEYDEDTRPKRVRNRKSSSGFTTKSSSPLTPTSATTIPMTNPRIKRSSSETVYFGDVDGPTVDYVSPPPSFIRRKEVSDDDEDDVVLGLGKKRKSTAIRSLGGLAPSMPFGSTGGNANKRKATGGGTAKDRIKSLLMKRR
ncbi:Clavaminate synthase-like protein [Linnemannia elongata AG-77]|uniref:JmjC domain-containing histone demethylation protein 1 n=1 Tax=Linnemannia elongata AG-77 TaxID=1314771 RepID=A0A197JK65_9FUNG|nr:Clavaminate synthase-like protein [Linnemannia elongata AG-77]